MLIATTLKKQLFFLLLFCLSTWSAYAQPTNDKCSGAILLSISTDEVSCEAVEGDTRGTEDATIQTDAPEVCSGGWYQDDVWFKFDIGDVIPENGVTVKCYFTGTGDDVEAVGMASYRSCDVSEIEIKCFSTEDPTINSLTVEPQCMTPNSSYYIRIWSGVSAADNSGTFRICAYNTPVLVNTDVLIWSDDFDEGIGEWITTGLEDPELAFLWDATVTFNTAYGGTVSLESATSTCNGAVGFPAGWYQGGMTGNEDDLPDGAPYPRMAAELVSPSINCTDYAAVAVKFQTAFRGLNGSADSELGALFSFSINGGESWSNPVDASESFIQGEGVNDIELRFSMPGAGGQPDVRIRFTFDGDFYYWLIDDVRVIEPESNNLRVNPFFAVPNNRVMPAEEVEPIYFMADIENIGSRMQTNVNLNISITDDNTGDLVYTDDLSYGDVMPDFVYENIPFENAWTPPSVATNYTGVYTITADSTDFDIANNTQSFALTIEDGNDIASFAKSTTVTGQIRPGDGNWNEGAAHSWTMGCFYHMNSNQGWVQSVEIGINNPEDLEGQSVLVWLYKWDNADGDNVAQETERTRVAFNQYVFDGTETSPFLLETQLVDFATGNLDAELRLDPDSDYLVMMEYNAPDDQTDLFLSVSSEVDYSAQVFMNSPYVEDASGNVISMGIGSPRYASVLGIPDNGDFSQGIDFTMTTFTGEYRTAQINMNMGFGPTGSAASLLNENVMNLYPNPVQDNLSITLDLENVSNTMDIHIMDTRGIIQWKKRYTNIQKDQLSIDVNHLTAGMYYVSIFTDKGTLVKPFIVQK